MHNVLTHIIGSLRADDVSRAISPNAVSTQQVQQPVVVQAPTDSLTMAVISKNAAALAKYEDTMAKLNQRLNEPFVTVNTVTGDKGIKQAQDEYDRLMRNKSPKSRRKN